jgi:hypothetical protein
MVDTLRFRKDKSFVKHDSEISDSLLQRVADIQYEQNDTVEPYLALNTDEQNI